VDSISTVVWPLPNYNKSTILFLKNMFTRKQAVPTTIKLFLSALNLQRENNEVFPHPNKISAKKKNNTTLNNFFFKNKLLIIIMESQKVEGLISSVNYEICHCGKKLNSIRRDCKRKRKREIEYEMPKPNPFGEKGMAAPSSYNLHYFLFLFMFLLILINGEDPNSDRSWVMIFRLNWVFPTTDLSHCNHCPIFLPSASKTAESNEQ
jgi:hypothetical protein